MQAFKKTRQDVIAAFRSAQILDAACKIFARKGFEGASVDGIAAAAGLAKGTVYVYFHSKRDLYVAAVRRGMAALIAESGRETGEAGTVAAKIGAFIAARVRYAEKNRDFAAIYHAEFGGLHPTCLDKEFKNLYLQQLQPVEAVLREARAQGQIHAEALDTTAFLVCEMTDALIGRRLLGWSRMSADEDIQFLFDLLWRGLAAPRDSDRPEKTACMVPGHC